MEAADSEGQDGADASHRDSVSDTSSKTFVDVPEPVKIGAATISMLGIGCSSGYYLAAAGFFQHTFESQMYFLWMIIAFYVPYPATLILQERFDEYFDRRFSTRQTYFFRVVLCQLYSIGAFAGLSLCYRSPAGVLVCGCIIGFLSSACLASTMQLMSSWEPSLAAWASLGKEIGGVLPVVTYYMLEFRASAASVHEFQRMQLFPGVALFLCSSCGIFMHFSGILDKAYSRLGYDLQDTFLEEEQHPSRVISEADPLLDANEKVDDHGVPFWMSRWQTTMGYNTFLTFLLMPMICFRGNPDLTQHLTLGKLLMDCLSRAIAAGMTRTGAFSGKRPYHYCLIMQQLFRTVLFLLLVMDLMGVLSISSMVFMCVWYLHYFEGGFTASQIEVTIVQFAPVAMRKSISRRSSLANYIGLGFALVLDLIIFFV